MKPLMMLTLLATSVGANAMSAGEYVAKAGDCTACHTSPQGQELAGGMRFATPLGNIYATNITPDKTHGIGNYSFEDFDKAMRQGIAKDGHHLYPAMPYTSYAKMTPEDMRALYDYLMTEVKPQSVENQKSDIPWPLSMRWPLGIWNSLFLQEGVYQPQSEKGDEWNRGAYLVQGAGHCGACHTPRGWAMQEQGMDQAELRFLNGAELDGWYAPSLRGLNVSKDDLVALLKSGRSRHAALSGPMGDVVTHSSQYLTDSDLNGIATYLLSLEALPSDAKVKVPTAASMQSGAQTYARYCSTCHNTKGEGVDYTIPRLAGNLTVNADNPQTLIRVVLDGAQTPVTQQHMSYGMPGYGWALDDRQAADLMSYLRGSWGNKAEPITPEQVGKVRKELGK